MATMPQDTSTVAAPEGSGTAPTASLAPSGELSVDVEIRLKSPNVLLAEHFKSRHWRRKRERKLTLQALDVFTAPQLKDDDRLIVTITRFGPAKVDSDNLAFSAKSVRDAVAEWLGVDDADPRVDWAYRQEKHREKVMIRGGRGKPAKPGFRVFTRVHIAFEDVHTRERIVPTRHDVHTRERIVPTAPSEDVNTASQPEDVNTPGEGKPRGEPPITWLTQPGTVLCDVADPARSKTAHLRATHKTITHPVTGQKLEYVHLAVHFMWRGRKVRSRGAAIYMSEIPAIITALQSVVEAEASETPSTCSASRRVQRRQNDCGDDVGNGKPTSPIVPLIQPSPQSG